MKSEPFVSVNALLLFLLPTLGMMLLLGGSIGHIHTASGWLLPFALLGLISPLVYLSLGQRPSERSDRRRFWWATTATLLLVLGLTARQFIIRPPYDHPNGMYDGAIQSEVAAGFLLQGKNPYGADYRGTIYQAVNRPIVGDLTTNVVWFHYIYPPLNFLVYLPISLLKNFLGPLADYRLISVGALLILTWLLIRRAATWSERTTAMLLSLGNPLVWIYAVIGCNEPLVALFIVAAALQLGRQRWFWSGVMFGLAMAAKQMAWPLLPLWLYLVWRRSRSTSNSRRHVKQAGGGALLAMVVLFLPFFLWSPGRMYTDIITFASGGLPWAYPISGTTILQYLHVFGLIPSPYTIIPTYLFQLVVGIPVFVMTASWIRISPQPSRWLAGSAVLLLSIMLVSRYFNNNFLTIIALLLTAAYVLQRHEQAATLEDSYGG